MWNFFYYKKRNRNKNCCFEDINFKKAQKYGKNNSKEYEIEPLIKYENIIDLFFYFIQCDNAPVQKYIYFP